MNGERIVVLGYVALLVISALSGILTSVEGSYVTETNGVNNLHDVSTRDYTPHAPISINGDADFATQAAAKGGPVMVLKEIRTSSRVTI